MPKLTIIQNGIRRETEFSGTPLLSTLLAECGFALDHPCGGRGSCGKCRVEISGAVSEMNAAEHKAGGRLSCQVVLLGDAEVILPDDLQLRQIETAFTGEIIADTPMPGKYGAAVDIGTTTIALMLYDLQSGRCVASSGMGNPQTAVAADVMGRIDAALKGQLEDLQLQLTGAIESLLNRACEQAGLKETDVQSAVIAGNTTMLYLLTGRMPHSLARAPFQADYLFGTEEALCGLQAYLPPCMNAFVGADISCAVLASGMTRAAETSLLIDIGTNGEIALWKNGTLYVTSTAAGPAFEGAGISCGMNSAAGAIDRVYLEKGEIRVHIIGGEPARGVCGSGLIDAIACFLQNGNLNETGAVDGDDLPLTRNVRLQKKDVRAVQLAKAAIAAGIETLLETAHTTIQDVQTLYIAGGFGSHLDVNSAARIGLFPAELKSRVQVLGNAALAGSARILLNRADLQETRAIAAAAQHVKLSGNPAFSDHYMDHMFFPEDE